MTHVTIDWHSAQVHDGELTVGLSEPASHHWRERFDALGQRLSRSGEDWGDVSAKKRRVVVTGVREGAETDLRHFLESIVLEANGPEPSRQAEHEPGDDADERMTRAFQDFAEGADRQH